MDRLPALITLVAPLRDGIPTPAGAAGAASTAQVSAYRHFASLLISITWVVLAMLGCEEGSAVRPGAPPGRVVAVAAAEEDVEDLCEVAPAVSAAPVLTFPALASGTAPGAPGQARWINVWATWCRPCVEEMPMLAEWTTRMRAERADVELVFLSADATDEAVTAFRASHAAAPETLRMADPAALEAWVTTVGLDAGATLPIHVITDAQGRVRCARTGAVSEDDYERMRDLVRGL